MPNQYYNTTDEPSSMFAAFSLDLNAFETFNEIRTGTLRVAPDAGGSQDLKASSMASEEGGRTAPLAPVVEQVRSILAERALAKATIPVEIGDDDRLADLRVDSIAIALVFAHFEKSFDVAFDNDQLNPKRYETVRDLASVIAERLQARA
jgi:acyl carrier protein